MAITIRIDEFSAPSDIDGNLSTEEQTRFLTVGFDFPLDPPPEPPAVPDTPYNRIYFIQPVNKINTIAKTNRINTVKKTQRTFTV